MKNLLLMLSVLLISAGCGPDTSQTEDAVKLSVDKTSIEFASAGGDQTFTVTSSGGFYFPTMEADWLTVEKGGKDADNKTVVTVSAAENTLPLRRQAKISISNGKEKAEVDVVQAAFGEGVTDGPLAMSLPNILGVGWNLGNHFDAYSDELSGETVWGNPKATQFTFNRLKNAGFSTVRIPVTWLGHYGEAPDYQIEAAWIDRIAEVVGYAKNAGLNVVINMHHDGADSAHWLDIKNAAKDPAVHQQILEQISAMWRQIAGKFRNEGEYLIFESFNEIHDGAWGWGENMNDGGKQYQCLNEWNQAFVTSVRSVGGENADRLLAVPAYCTNVDIAIESFVMPEDSVEDRLIMAVHCYDPYDYTLPATKSEWGHTAAADMKVAGDNEADLERVFVKIHDNFISKGVPVYMGEFGCVNRATEREQQFQQYYFRYYAKLSKMYGVPCMVWDNGAKGAGNEKHAFFDHGTGDYCSPEAMAAMNALVESYNDNLTLEQVYQNAPK